MPDLYSGRTMDVKPNCTPADVYRDKYPVHDVYMVGKPHKKPEKQAKPPFEPSKLLAYRRKAGMSQHELSARIGDYLKANGLETGHSYSMIGRIERGLEPYNQIIMQAAAHIFETDVKSILFVEPDEASVREEIIEVVDELLKRRRKA